MKRKFLQKILTDDGERGATRADKSSEEDFHKNYHWKTGTTHNSMEVFFSLFTGLYFMMILLMYSESLEVLTIWQYVGWSFVLSILPFYRVRRVFNSKGSDTSLMNLLIIRSPPIRVALSSLALLVSIKFIESYLGGKNLMLLYFGLAILFRLVDSRSLYDCIALCTVYSIDFGGSPTIYQKIWFSTTRLLLWECVLLGILCGILLRRSTFRIWENVRLLIIFMKKSEEERKFSDFIAAAHFSPDLIESAIKRREVLIETQEKQERGSYCDNDSSCESNAMYSSTIAEAASEAGILFSFHEKPALSIEKIRSLDGLERKLATVIAFKLVMSDERECCLNGQKGHMMQDLLDRLAIRQKVSCVRKFGDTWVGCIGLHNGWDNSRKDSYHALLLGCEALILAKKMQLQLCCAVESGKIDAGFVGCSNYDVFGPEIR
jgi:hypothetical protein